MDWLQEAQAAGKRRWSCAPTRAALRFQQQLVLGVPGSHGQPPASTRGDQRQHGAGQAPRASSGCWGSAGGILGTCWGAGTGGTGARAWARAGTWGEVGLGWLPHSADAEHWGRSRVVGGGWWVSSGRLGTPSSASARRTPEYVRANAPASQSGLRDPALSTPTHKPLKSPVTAEN